MSNTSEIINYTGYLMRLFLRTLSALLVFGLAGLALSVKSEAGLKLLETEHVRLVYFGGAPALLSPHLGRCFENSYRYHTKFWDYQPSEKITLVMLDASDYGNAGALATPRNRIFISVSPMSLAYETSPVNERMNQMMNHELVHIVALDKATGDDKAVSVVSNPEFLREGYAVYDFMNPSRIMIGSHNAEASQLVADLHRPLDAQVVFTEPSTAEMIKYASNSFLAMKISFINEIASMCDGAGIDVAGVAHGIGLDPRIGKDFLQAGIGYGGSSLPKDTAMLTHFAESKGVDPSIMKAVRQVNAEQPRRLVERLREQLGTLDGAKIAIFGLSFKPNTDDLRYSSALKLVELLMAENVQIAACDPIACKNVSALPCGPEYVLDPYQAVTDSDAVILATEWSEYVDIDLNRVKAAMKGNLFVDGRNAMHPEKVTEAGFTYMGIGRGGVRPAQSSEGTSATPMLLD